MLRIVHENEHWIAISKPSGRPTIAARGKEASLSLKEEVARHAGGRIFVVHRLDAETSGLVLFAQGAEAHRFLCAAFESRRVKKSYWALVLGCVETGGVVDRPLREFGSGRMGVDERGKSSQTRYLVLEKFSAATLLEVSPSTGRRHQIRVHLYSLGHPVLGDARYGKERPVGGAARLMLHARELSFSYEGKDFQLCAEPPQDFLRVLEKFRSGSGFKN